MSNADVEKDYAQNQHLESQMDADTALNRIRTAGSISISPELFEKIYLSPQNQVKGDLRKTFANPTPIALGGFLLALTPLTADLMGWRGAGMFGAASTGVYFGIAFPCMFVGGILEWILGNTFPAVVFTTFGGFWFAYGATLTPAFAAYSTYATDPSMPASGLTNPQFYATFGHFLSWMAVLCFIYFVASLRTNVVFAGIFLTIVCAFCCLTADFWYRAQALLDAAATGGMPDMSYALKMEKAGGAFAFVTCVLGWYLFTIQVLAAVDFPLLLPVGDLSTVIKGMSDIKKNQ